MDNRKCASGQFELGLGPRSRFNPVMLTIARDAKQITQEDLAAALKVSQAQVSKWDNGISVPSPETISVIAGLLGVRPGFFEVECEKIPTLFSDFFHRGLTTAPRAGVKAAHARCRMYDIQIRRLLELATIPDDRIPHLPVTAADRVGKSTIRHMEDVATRARSALGIPRGPIENLSRTLESAGGIVIDEDLQVDQIDALCRWIPGLPKVFFVNGRKPADRLRFSLAHELAHTVLHFGTETPAGQAENEADAFAAAFLMPAADFESDVRSDLRISDLAQLKRKWRVSMQAIAHRAHDLKLISDQRFKSIYVEFSRKKWRTQEPVTVPGETPTTFRSLIKQASDKGLSPAELSQILLVEESRVAELIRDVDAPTWEAAGVRLRLVGC